MAISNKKRSIKGYKGHNKGRKSWGEKIILIHLVVSAMLFICDLVLILFHIL